MNERIPSVHIGCCNFAQGRLAAHLQSSSLELTACVDPQKESAERVLAELGASLPVYKSLEEALRSHSEIRAAAVFAGTRAHAQLILESLQAGLHTLCVKPIAIDREQFLEIEKAHAQRPELVLAQGQNLRWTSSFFKLREWVESDRFGDLLGGNIEFWVRQTLAENDPDATVEGMFYHCAAGHQLDQIIAIFGLPQQVYAQAHRQIDITALGQRSDVWGTGGGGAMLTFPNGAIINYHGTRAGHADLAQWSGRFTLRGTNGDIVRDSGSLALYQQGNAIEELQVDDISNGIVQEDLRQMDAFGRAISGEADAADKLPFETWAVLEALNESAKTGSAVDYGSFRSSLAP